MRKRKPRLDAGRAVGMYLCHACGRYVEREAEAGQPLKRWRKSFCERTGRNVRIWLKLMHNMPDRHGAGQGDGVDGIDEGTGTKKRETKQ